MTTRILFVDDEESILDGLRRMLRPARGEWDMAFANGGEAALAVLESSSFDVIVTDMRMPGIDGAMLLEIVREKYPNMFRMVLSGYTELQASLRAIPVAHQFLLKPCEPEMLRKAIARARGFGEALDSKLLVNLIGSLRDLPSQPSTFAQLKQTLADPASSLEQITQIVEKDVALSAKLLQLVNSAFFGLAREVSDIKTAVSCLGIAILQDLVLTLELFRAFRPNEYFTEEVLDEFHAHSQRTSRIANVLCVELHIPQPAVLAAMLHDVGKLVIAERTPAHFARSLAQAAEEGKPLYEIEEKLIHISHAEVGAYLLSLWGLPQPIVEAVAHHHHPRRTPHEEFDIDLLVYLSNLLAHEREAADTKGTPPAYDMELLTQVGVADRLDSWRSMALAMEMPQRTPVA